MTSIDRIGGIDVFLTISHLIFVLLDNNCDIIKNNIRKWLVADNDGVRNIILMNSSSVNK